MEADNNGTTSHEYNWTHGGAVDRLGELDPLSLQPAGTHPTKMGSWTVIDIERARAES
jgi:hypothetical protein